MRRWNSNSLRVSFIIFRFHKDNKLERLLLWQMNDNEKYVPAQASSHVERANLFQVTMEQMRRRWSVWAGARNVKTMERL
jgi:hypothetical protein